MRKYFTIWFLLFCLLNIKAQTKADTVLLLKYIDRATALMNSDEDAALASADSAIKIGTQISMPGYVADALFLKGRMHQNENRLSKAFDEYQKAYDLASEVKDTFRISWGLHNLADVYKFLRMQPQAIAHLKQAIELIEKTGRRDALISYFHRLGHVYMDYGDDSGNHQYYDIALSNYNTALKISESTSNLSMLSTSYVNLANAYLVMVKHGDDTSKISTSIGFSQKGLQYAEEAGDKMKQALNILNIGEAELLRKNFPAALQYFEKALALYKQINHVLWITATLRDIAMAYEGMNQNQKAIEAIESANQLSIKYNHTEEYGNYLLLSELYDRTGNHQKALEAYKRYHQLLDLSNNVLRTIQLERIHMQDELNKKEEDIRLLNDEVEISKDKQRFARLLNYVLVAGIILIILISFLLYNRSRLLKKTADLAEQARVMQEQFIANTSHEIRTPLNGIMGMTDKLKETTLTSEQKEYLQLMERSSENLLRIMNDLIDLSKIKAGKLEFRKRHFLTRPFLEGMKVMLMQKASKKGIELIWKVEKEFCSALYADDLRIQQVIMNLAENAVKFTEAGSVELNFSSEKVSENKVRLNIAVKDTGPGIPVKERKRIFESFVQLENSGQRFYGGSGLGLAIVKSLVEGMQGSIEVADHVPAGTEFRFVLQVEEGDIEKVRSDEFTVKTQEHKIPQGLKILVAEDNEINRKVLEGILIKWNCEYVMCEDAVQTLDVLTQEKFDMILMDIELPGLSGLEATKYIRQKFKTGLKEIPIVALTAYTENAEHARYLEAGIAAVVTKPVNEIHLGQIIIAVLQNENVPVQITSAYAEESGLFAPLDEKYGSDEESKKELVQLMQTEFSGYATEYASLISSSSEAELKKFAHLLKGPAGLFNHREFYTLLNECEQQTNLFLQQEQKKKRLAEILQSLLKEIDNYLKK